MFGVQYSDNSSKFDYVFPVLSTSFDYCIFQCMTLPVTTSGSLLAQSPPPNQGHISSLLLAQFSAAYRHSSQEVPVAFRIRAFGPHHYRIRLLIPFIMDSMLSIPFTTDLGLVLLDVVCWRDQCVRD